MIKNIKRSAFWEGSNTPHYFHPSVCNCKDGLLMTLQTFEGASDTYGPVMWSFSNDNGTSWSSPEEIEALAHRKIDGDITEGIADVRPFYHHPTGAVIAIGCNTYYNSQCHCRDKRLSQFPVYAISPSDDSWSGRKELKAEFFKDCGNWRVACAQALVLPDGDVLLPVYFDSGKEDTKLNVCTLKCSFDGATLTPTANSNVLSSDVGRGLIEPSLALLNGKYYMTIRAEDERAYLSISEDGLSWQKPVQWCWDDGSALVTSTTQQHWIGNGKSLYLIYTRQTENNSDSFRWRAPLLTARFDEKRLCLVKDSEKEIFPLVRTNNITNALGNFHAVDILPSKSIVSVGSLTRKVGEDPATNFFSDTWLAEIEWS